MQLQAFTFSKRINDVIVNTSSIVGKGATAIVYKARYDNDNEDQGPFQQHEGVQCAQQ